MSKVKDTQTEETFSAKLDIQMVSPAAYRTMLDVYAAVPRAVVTAIGKPGIGKTAIPKQAARARKAPYGALHVPTMMIEDIKIPTTAVDTKQFYDNRIPRHPFQALIEFVAKLREENDGEFPTGRNPILSIEELNRAADKHVTKGLFTLIEDRKVGDVFLDEAIQIVVTMNPSGGAMGVNEFERDPAHRRRLLMVGVATSYGDFLRHAREAEFHPKVVEHLEAQPTWLYDDEALKASKKYACPSAWDTISQLCKTLDVQQMALDDNIALAAFAGTIGATAAEAFVEFIKDATVVITPDEILERYKEKSQVRERLKKLVVDSRMDKISTLISGVAMKMYATSRTPEALRSPLSLFIKDIPEDARLAFIKELVEQATSVANGKKRLNDINIQLAQEPAYQEAAARLQQSQQKAKDEAKASGAT